MDAVFAPSIPTTSSASPTTSSQPLPSLEIPSTNGSRPRARSPSQRFPSTALFTHSRIDSNVDGHSPRDNDGPSQRLPRPRSPTALSARASAGRQSHFTAPMLNTIAPQRTKTPSTPGIPDSYKIRGNVEDLVDFNTMFNADSIWNNMQATLADVELSALNNSTSSHMFSASHSKALEDLRIAQLSLAQAWARSEADDVDADSNGEDEADFGEAVGKASGLTSSPKKHRDGKDGVGVGAGHHTQPGANDGGRRRASSAASSVMGRDLEAETERDIKLARRRREANDKYFQQVNKGVVDVVAKLDQVAQVMRRVETESREVWREGSGSSSSVEGTARSNIARQKDEDPGPDDITSGTEDEEELKKFMTRASTELGPASDSDVLSESPASRTKTKNR